MRSGLPFLLAARECEIGDLEQLAQTSELVSVIGWFIHALQRERGTSNVFLASGGLRFGAQRMQQMAECEQIEREVRRRFGQLDTERRRVRNGARLFSRIAAALHGLDGLPALRERIAAQAVAPRDAVAAFVTVIGTLLAVVFEAVDSATDPDVSRALVAMFHFMQGKELAGQERAFGSAVFAAGHADPDAHPAWRHLIDSQQACFDVFADLADPEARAAEAQAQDPAVLAAIERLRRLGASLVPGATVDTSMAQEFYELCTRRIDALRAVEDLLAAHLRALCERRIETARDELRDRRVELDGLLHQIGAEGAQVPPQLGPQVEKSVLGMVQEQSRRIQAMTDELDAVRAALTERKVIERAKGLLMAHRHLSEDDAHKALLRMAMNQKRRLIDVAEAVLTTADVLRARPH